MVSNKIQVDRFQEATEKYVSIYWELSITVGLDKMAQREWLSFRSVKIVEVYSS